MKIPNMVATQYERYDVHHPNYAWMCRQPSGYWTVYCKDGPSWGWNHVINKWVVCTLIDRYDSGQFYMTFAQASEVMATIPSKSGLSGESRLNTN